MTAAAANGIGNYADKHPTVYHRGSDVAAAGVSVHCPIIPSSTHHSNPVMSEMRLTHIVIEKRHFQLINSHCQRSTLELLELV